MASSSTHMVAGMYFSIRLATEECTCVSCRELIPADTTFINAPCDGAYPAKCLVRVYTIRAQEDKNLLLMMGVEA